MSIRKPLFSLVLACLVGLLFVTPALAFPPLPSSFYGKVKVDGKNVPDGTVVRALVGGKVYAQARTQTYQDDSVFSLDVPGDDSSSTEVEGGKEGEAIQFEVGGVPASQIGTWHSGTNVNLDLAAKSSGPLETPAPASMPVPTQTAITAGVPPTIQSPTQIAAASTTASATKPSGLGAALIGLVVVILAGGGTMIWFNRKRKK